MLALTKSIAFIKKDFIIERSYKISFIVSLFNSLFPVISFYFVGKLIEGKDFQILNKYGGDYFNFVFLGIAFTRYFQISVNTFANSIKTSQMAGCFEAILSSQTPPWQIVIMSSLYSFLSSAVQLIIMFIIGIIIFDLSFPMVNVSAASISILLSLLSFISLGIIAASITVLTKQGTILTWALGALSAFLGGSVFPIEVLPSWLRVISYVIPVTYSLEALRLSILQGYTFTMLIQQFYILSLFILISFPLSLYFFQWSIEKGKREGSLSNY